MKKKDTILVIIAIVVLLILIGDRLNQMNTDKIQALEQNKIELLEAINQNEMAIKDIQEKQSQITLKLGEWDDIDKRWLYWIEDNWHIVKSVGGKDGR